MSSRITDDLVLSAIRRAEEKKKTAKLGPSADSSMMDLLNSNDYKRIISENGDSVKEKPAKKSAVELKMKRMNRQKTQSAEIADLLAQSGKMSTKGYDRMLSCCDWPIYLAKVGEEDPELLYVYRCDNRLCPICQKAQANKAFAVHSEMFSRLGNDLKGLFLTLTVRNIKKNQAKKIVKELNKAVGRLMRFAKIAGTAIREPLPPVNGKRKWLYVKDENGNQLYKNKLVLGWMKKIEVTYNQERDDYHFHIHMILIVPKGYRRTSKKYIKQEEWRDMWRKAMRLDYDPVVDIRTAKKSDYSMNQKPKDAEGGTPGNAEGGSGSTLGAGITKEISKYASKPIELNKLGIGDDDDDDDDDDKKAEILGTIYEAFRNQRVISYGGILKELKAEIDAEKEAEKEEMRNATLSDEGMSNVAEYLETISGFSFKDGKYEIADTRKLVLPADKNSKDYAIAIFRHKREVAEEFRGMNFDSSEYRRERFTNQRKKEK